VTEENAAAKEGKVCLICLGESPEQGDYHEACLQELFARGAPPLPPASLQETKQQVFDLVSNDKKMSISGAQPKALVRINDDFLEIVDRGSTHILKTPSETYGHLPANEHATMLAARLMGLEVPPCGLMRLGDGALVYLIRRFDRNGEKRNTNDFCQILGVQPEQKSRATAEQCAEKVAEYCQPPGPSLEKLFRLFVVAYVLHNGDLHLKNLSLIEDKEGNWGLSPVYDLVNTMFYERNMWSFTLSINGEKKDIARKHWLLFGERGCGLGAGRAAEILDGVLKHLPGVKELVGRSLLPREWKGEFSHQLDKRERALRGARRAG